MVDPYTKLKIRRRMRKTQREAVKVQDQTAENFEKHVTRRWRNLLEVKRFVIGWLILVFLLGSGVIIQTSDLRAYYQTEVPADGGTYVEGIVGEVTNLNPIFASNATDSSISALIFDSLVEYDADNNLVGELADSWEVDKDGTTYTFYLRDDLVWHDGMPLSASDVIFTIESIQHPDSRSPLNSSWQDIKAQALDDKTVTFTLPNPFTPFIHALTVGIIPAHILQDIPIAELRAHEFNLQPLVGSGPFVFDQLVLEEKASQTELLRNDDYRKGAPRLRRFIVRSFEDHESMIVALNEGQVSGAAGLRSFDNELIDETLKQYDLPLQNVVFLFMKTTDDVLKDGKVRKALVRATDRTAIFDLLGNRYAIARGPLLPNQLGYDETLNQPKFNLKKAKQLLDEAGWRMSGNGFRKKGGKELKIELVTQSEEEFPKVVEALQQQWAKVGIRLKPQLVSPGDLQQSHIVPHNYQSILLDVSVGIDPDVFVYWHSSQAEVRGFNFSEYDNEVVDEALGAGRIRDDEELRVVKYQAFLEEWVKDLPAIALYQSGFGYAQSEDIAGFEASKLVSPTDRYRDVHLWTVNTKTVPKTY